MKDLLTNSQNAVAIEEISEFILKGFNFGSQKTTKIVQKYKNFLIFIIK